jgi:hypothetical protein
MFDRDWERQLRRGLGVLALLACGLLAGLALAAAALGWWWGNGGTTP